MRLSISLSVLAYVAQLAAAKATITDAYVYLFEPEATTTQGALPTVSPTTARLILAEKLGLSQFHSLGDVHDSELSYINKFASASESIWGPAPGSSPPTRSVLVIEDVERLEDIFPRGSASPSFAISQPRGLRENDLLLRDFVMQARSVEGSDEESDPVKEQQWPQSQYNSIWTDWAGSRTFTHYRTLKDATSSSSSAYSELTEQLQAIMKEWSDVQGTSHSRYVIVMPPSSTRKSSKSSVGAYGFVSQKSKRQVEAPLEIEPTKQTMPSSSPAQVFAKNTTAPRGILPSCFTSQDACESATNNCSGHGSCVLKYSDPTDDAARKCYGCACKPVKTKVGKSEKTTYYGGPACQKKDISTPFWLLAGFSLFIVAALSYGVGLLVSIGNEELPSVIGAGVAGPRVATR